MRITRQAAIAAGIGLVVGVLVILGIRFATYHPERTHYHANFDVYINGQREAFKEPAYYEEEGGSNCTADTITTPAGRVHMHDNVSDVIHVHDQAVTWGQFFQNLGWNVNDKLVQTRDNVYLADSTHQVSFILNGQPYQDVTNEVIHDKDRLLVDYGSTSQTNLRKEFKAVPGSAAQYDAGKDPNACMSNAAPTLSDRLKHLL